MKLLRLIILFQLFLGLHINCDGQYFISGQNPSSVTWRQINTAHFQVIYPDYCDSIGQYTAARLEHIYKMIGHTMGHDPKKVSIILQSNTTTSNGFVTWAPKRSEFYTTPPQDNDVINWIDLLAIHEFRHVVQIDKLNQGFTRLIYFLLGEQAIGGVLGLAVPPWFLEGDATLTETVLSQGGRGRLAIFETRLRTQLKSMGPYSYSKAQFGSYKDYVPSHYHLGYYLTAYGRRTYGPDIWDKTIKRIARFPFVPFRFSTALKKETGVSSRMFYEQAMAELDSIWTHSDSLQNKMNYEVVNSRKNSVPLDYQLPISLPNGKVLAVKSGYGQINQLVVLGKDEKEERQFTFGPYRKYSLSTNGSKVVWAEVRFNKRYSYENYSVIQILDLETKKIEAWKSKTKYFSPAISPKGEKIVVVEVSNKAECGLRIVDINDNSSGYNLTNMQAGVLYRHPSWSEDEAKVYCVRQDENGNSIVEIDVVSGDERIVFGPIFENLNYPSLNADRLLFHAAFSGVDNIYMLSLSTKMVVQLTDVKSGAYQPSWCFGGDSILFSQYSPVGHDVVKLSLKEGVNKPVQIKESEFPNYFEPLLDQELATTATETLKDTVYASSKYNEPLHWFNIHSWQPYSQVGLGDVNPNLGFSIMSQNKLSTVVTVLQGSYDYRQKVRKLELDMDFLKPELQLGLNFHDRLFFDQNIELDNGDVIDEILVRGTDISLSYPMNLTKSKYQVYARWTGAMSLNYLSYVTPQVEELYSETNIPLSTEVSIVRSLNRSKRDVLSRWEQGYSFYVWRVIFGEVNSEQVFLYNRLWANFPGFLKHHVAVVEYMNESNSGLAFQAARLPRGYRMISHTNLDLLSFRYSAPIAYPDLNLSFLTYVQRIKATLFAEYGRLNKAGSYFGLPSYGVELSADMNLLRYFLLFDIGVRYAYADELGNPHTFDLLFDFSF